MRIAVAHGDAMVVAEQPVDGDGWFKPASARANPPCPRRRERARRHQGVQFDQIVLALDYRQVRAGSGMTFDRESAKRTGAVGFSHPSRFTAKIPDIEVIDAAAWVLFAAVPFVENNPRVGPDRGGKSVVKTGSHQSPFSAERVANHADAVGAHSGPLSQNGVGVRRRVGQSRKRLHPHGLADRTQVWFASILAGILQVNPHIGFPDA